MDAPENAKLKEHSNAGVVVTALATIGCFLIFGIIVLITIVYDDKEEVDAKAIEFRQQRYENVTSAAAEQIDSYSWVNKEEGIVRIPVKRAMQLTIEGRRANNTSE